jgi:hypothetical protein
MHGDHVAVGVAFSAAGLSRSAQPVDVNIAVVVVAVAVVVAVVVAGHLGRLALLRNLAIVPFGEELPARAYSPGMQTRRFPFFPDPFHQPVLFNPMHRRCCCCY